MPKRTRQSRLGAALLVALCGALSARAELRGLDPQKTFTQYGLDVWTTEEGLPNGTVNALVQTRDGYLWIGTYDGLARFDGVRFTVFTTSTTAELGSNGIRALAQDKDGSLWIGTNGGGLTRFLNGRFSRFTTRDGLPNDFVWALRPDPRDGGLWIGTNGGGLARFVGGTFTTYSVADSGRTVYSIAQGPDGSVWLGTQSEGVRRLAADGTWTTFTQKDGLPASIATAVAVDHAGQVLVGTNGGGLARLAAGRFVAVTATQETGLVNVSALSEDREGSLWIGTSGGGLARLRDGSFVTFSTQEGLQRDLTYAVFEDRDDGMWIGTAGGLSHLESGRATTDVLAPGSHPLAVRSIAQDRAGDLWAATYGGGVFRRHAGRWRAYTVKDGLGHDSVRARKVDRQGRVWAATLGGLSVFEKEAWRTYRVQDGLPRDSVIGVVEDGNGDIWTGSDGAGVSRFHAGRFQIFTTHDGLASNVTLALAMDGDGALWIGTNGGLSRFRRDRFVSFTAPQDLPSDAISQIVDDGHGQLWLGTSKGIARVAKSSFAAAGTGGRLGVLTFTRADGMKSAQCTAPGQPGGLRDRNGRLWFSTTRGVVVVDPAHLRHDTTPPPVFVESVWVDGRAAAQVEGPLRVAAGASRVEFRYTGLCLLAPSRVAFRFRLQGFDAEWIEAQERRVADYTGLRPGRYVFQVRAANAQGVWNDAGASVALEVLPRFYQTRTFAAALASASSRSRWRSTGSVCVDSRCGSAS